MQCCIDIGCVGDDQCVVVVYFEGQYFFWLVVEVVMEVEIGCCVVGEQYVVDIMIFQQCLVGGFFVLQQVDCFVGDVCLLLQLDGYFSGSWCQFVGFKYNGVFGDQCWNDMFVGQVVWEVVGVKDCYYVVWFVVQQCFIVWQC